MRAATSCAVRRARLGAALVLAIGLWPLDRAAAQTPLGALRYVPDVAVRLGASTVAGNTVAQDDLAGQVALVDVGALPAAVHVTAYDRLPNGDHLLAFNVDVVLPGGLPVRPGTVVRRHSGGVTPLFNPDAHGIPRGVHVDALAAIGPNDLLLSFDRAVALGALRARRSDVVRFHDGSFSLHFDAAAAGVSAGLDLDALHLIPGSGRLLVSFDGSGQLGGVRFGDQDVLEVAPSGSGWTLAYAGESEHPGWRGADLQALWAQPASVPAPVAPAIVAPGGSGSGGAVAGTSRVTGIGTPRALACTTCIEIYALGPNGVADAPPGSVDDVLLGIGGTDASGAFVDCDGTPGIPLFAPLAAGERLVAVDVCADLTGPPALVASPAAAPALHPAALALALALLLAIARRRLHPAQARTTRG